MSRAGRVALAALAVTAFALAAATTTRAVPAPWGACTGERDAYARYGWPVAPFDRQHPIRGAFGDPRTVERSDQTVEGPRSVGSFTFHNGIDVVAKDGTDVYAVVTGTAVVKHRFEVSVHVKGGRIFQYWHIVPQVRTGQVVVADRTVLGRIKHGAHHVHLSEIDGLRAVNPLAPGHLGPYSDTQPPAVKAVLARSRVGAPLRLDRLRGSVALLADTADSQPLRFWGPWFGMPVMPASVRWQLLADDGSDVLPWRVAVDFRVHEPRSALFWDIYAPGTHQNFPVLQDRFHFGEPGLYLVRLTHFLLDTRTLPNGRYVVSVEASDVCGNRGVLRQPVVVANTGVPAGPKLEVSALARPIP